LLHAEGKEGLSKQRLICENNLCNLWFRFYFMKTIYCISGLGADERAFSRLQIDPGYRLQVIPWILPLKNETIHDYAKRMSAAITEKDPILIGLSFGGIMCTEIARIIPVEKIIIVSSIKTSGELPGWMKAAAWLKLHKIVPLRSTKLTAPIQNHMLGVTDEEDKRIAEHYRKHADINYVKWAVDQVMNWKNDRVHPAIYHIHGDNDKLFPIGKTKPDYTVKDAGHFMIMNKAREVSELINRILKEGNV